jgi:pimeloyl-ACP methyl ester carboxylesterase
MGYFNYNQKRCYYTSVGKGEPLLLLHGNTASSAMFSDVVQYYADHFEVFLIDFLGHGKSERVERLATDLWFDEAMQVIAFLEQTRIGKVNIIGSSGGALVAINVALERPDRISAVIADSFEGEEPLEAFVKNVVQERELSKQDPASVAFYQSNHGDDWSAVVDNDTRAMDEHYKTIGKFFHKPLDSLQVPVLLTGSRQDEFVTPDFYEATFSKLLTKISNGAMSLFEQGSHPAMLSNAETFSKTATAFFRARSI